MFAESPYESGVRYQFLCGTKSEDEEYVSIYDPRNCKMKLISS